MVLVERMPQLPESSAALCRVFDALGQSVGVVGWTYSKPVDPEAAHSVDELFGLARRKCGSQQKPSVRLVDSVVPELPARRPFSPSARLVRRASRVSRNWLYVPLFKSRYHRTSYSCDCPRSQLNPIKKFICTWSAGSNIVYCFPTGLDVFSLEQL